MKRILLFLAIGWAVLFLTVVWFVDFDAQMQPLIQISDYLMTFHVAGYLVSHGQSSILYPPADSVAFAGMPFDKVAHQLLSKMPPSSVAEFMYMPLAAAVFIPFSAAPLNLSLFAWQILSLISLFVSVLLLWNAGTAGGGKEDVALGNGCEVEAKEAVVQSQSDANAHPAGAQQIVTRMLSSLWFIPACLAIWIGQVGMIFGMLPLAAGYLALRRERLFMAGVLWSVAVLKPQFLIPAAVVTFGFLVRRRLRVAFGMCAGAILLVVVSLIAFTPRLNLEWLHCLKVSDVVYSNPGSGIATHIATSLPRTLILLLPVASQPVTKPLIYGLAALLFASALFTVWKLQRSTSLPAPLALQLSLLIGLYVTPLVMPHFFFYDYCLFALTAPIAFLPNWTPGLQWPIRKLVLITGLVVNIYAVIVMVAHQYAMPWLLMGIMLGLYFYLVKLCFESANGTALQAQPTIP